MSRLSLTAAFTLGLLVAGCDRGAPDTAQESTATPAPTGEIDRSHAGEPLPDFRIEDVDGNVLKSSALTGSPTLVNFWATWCAPCVKEMPLLDDLAADYDGRVKVLTVSQDMDGADKVRTFFARARFTRLHPWLDPHGAFGSDLGVNQLPMTVLYDARNAEVWRISGDYDWSSEDARAAIDEAIGG